MKIVTRITPALFLLMGTGGAALAQAGGGGGRADSALVHFFTGEWKGEGTFANGRPIKARLVFRLALDSAWLVCEHRDEPPNRYQADLYWGVDAATGQFLAYAFDNFHGHRQFASKGWAGGRLLLARKAEAPGAGMYFEHFIYDSLTDSAFRMTYETSRDSVAWRLGDSLVFRRRGH